MRCCQYFTSIAAAVENSSKFEANNANLSPKLCYLVHYERFATIELSTFVFLSLSISVTLFFFVFSYFVLLEHMVYLELSNLSELLVYML